MKRPYRMKVKALPLADWMKDEKRDRVLRNYQQIYPIYYRQGIYSRNGQSWFEIIHHGQFHAYIYSQDSFKYNLALMHAAEYTPQQAAGLEAICATNFATRKQRALFEVYQQSQHIHNNQRVLGRVKVRARKFLKEKIHGTASN